MAKEYVAYDGPVVTLDEARSSGLLRYFTGKPCRPFGHISMRRVNDKICLGCAPHRRLTCRAERIVAAASWRAANPDRVKENRRLWSEGHRDQERSNTAAWKKANPEHNRALSQAYRASKLKASGSFGPDEIVQLLEKQRSKCVNCKASIKHKRHIDHIMPLSRGGSNGIKNIQLLCPSCNSSKNAKHPIDWAQQNGRLL